MIGNSMVLAWEGRTLEIPIVTWGARVTVPRETVEVGGLDRAKDGLMRELERWRQQGWTVLDDSVELHFEDDFLRNAYTYTLSARGYLGPGAITEVDRQVERDCALQMDGWRR